MSSFNARGGGSGAIAIARGWLMELRVNRRTMAGLLVILVLIAGEGFLLLRDATGRAQVAYAQQLVRLQRVAAIAQEREWPQREAASASLRAAFEARLWTAESDGVARADLQDWITGMARDIALPSIDVRIEATAPKSLPPELRRISATMTAQPSETALIALLDRVARAPHLLVVDRLDLKQQPNPYLELVLTSYARIGAKSAAGSRVRDEPR